MNLPAEETILGRGHVIKVLVFHLQGESGGFIQPPLLWDDPSNNFADTMFKCKMTI